MNINSAFSSNYLRAVDIKGQDVRVTIESFKIESIGQGSEAKELPVLRFKGKAAGFVLNKTNANIIQVAFGDETDDWTGKQVELYVTQVGYKGEMVDGIRCKVPQQPAQIEAVNLDQPDGDDVPF
jgi:hypothetical protein